MRGAKWRPAPSRHILPSSPKPPHPCQRLPHTDEPEPVKTGQQLIDEAKAKITQLSVAEAQARHGATGVVFLDCREPNEYNLGRIPGAVFIPRGQLETNIEARCDPLP